MPGWRGADPERVPHEQVTPAARRHLRRDVADTERVPHEQVTPAARRHLRRDVADTERV